MNNLFTHVQKWFATSTGKQKLTAILLGFSLLSTFALLMINASSSVADDPLDATRFYFLGVFVKLFGVLLLIVFCAMLFRRWMQPGSHGRKIQQLRLVETIRLSPKQAVHLISVGDQQLLIGATDQNVSLLAPVEVDLEIPEVTSPTTPSSMDFGSLIQMFQAKTPSRHG